MSKKRPPTTRRPTRTRRSSRSRHPTWKLVFNDAILQLVIRPALADAADTPLTSIGDFYARFQERHQCSVSLAQFKSWLKGLNLIHYFQGPRQINPFNTSPPINTLPPNLLTPAKDLPLGGDDDLVFDNEKAGFVPPELRGAPQPQPALPPELEAALRGNTHPITHERPRTVLPGFDLQMNDPGAGTLNLPGLTS